MQKAKKMKCWMRSVVLFILLFLAEFVYAVTIGETTKDVTVVNMTWPLVFNGLAPGAIILFVGKRYLDGQKEINRELIDFKNEHERRIGTIETIHHQKGCDQPDMESSHRGRRKEDRN